MPPGLNRVKRPFVTDANDIDAHVSLFNLIHDYGGDNRLNSTQCSVKSSELEKWVFWLVLYKGDVRCPPV